MSLISKKEFADKCGLETKHLSTYINRGKIVMVDEQFDTENEINKYFIEHRLGKNAGKTIPQVQPEEKKPEPAEEKLNQRTAEKKTEAPQPKFEFPPDTSVSEGFKLDTEAKRLSNEKLTNEIAMQQAKLDKLAGDSIPTQLVKNLIANHSKSITVAFRHGAETFIMQVGHKYGLGRKEIADMRADLIPIINRAVTDSVEFTKKDMDNIVAEYSQKREQGERT